MPILSYADDVVVISSTLMSECMSDVNHCSQLYSKQSGYYLPKFKIMVFHQETKTARLDNWEE